MISRLDITAPRETKVRREAIAPEPVRATSVVENLLRRLDNDPTRPQGAAIWQLAGE